MAALCSPRVGEIVGAAEVVGSAVPRAGQSWAKRCSGWVGLGRIGLCDRVGLVLAGWLGVVGAGVCPFWSKGGSRPGRVVSTDQKLPGPGKGAFHHRGMGDRPWSQYASAPTVRLQAPGAALVRECRQQPALYGIE